MSVKDAINQAITLLDRITVEADEDSALGMAFVSGRISEDGFYITKNDLERSLKELEQQLATAHRDATEEVAKAHKRGWEQGKQQASGICKADIQEHAITISAAQQETHNNCCNYLAKAIDAMEYNHGN